MRNLIVLAVVLAVVTSAPADELWDNNINTNGSNGQAISAPAGGSIRVADDFNVPSPGWIITGIRYDAIEDADWKWNNGDSIQVTFHEDHGGRPGSIFSKRTIGGMKEATGKTFFGRAEYHYIAEFSDEMEFLVAETTKFWVGVRNLGAFGPGTNYWMTSDGGPDGGRSSTGWWSTDNGNT